MSVASGMTIGALINAREINCPKAAALKFRAIVGTVRASARPVAAPDKLTGPARIDGTTAVCVTARIVAVSEREIDACPKDRHCPADARFKFRAIEIAVALKAFAPLAPVSFRAIDGAITDPARLTENANTRRVTVSADVLRALPEDVTARLRAIDASIDALDLPEQDAVKNRSPACATLTTANAFAVADAITFRAIDGVTTVSDFARQDAASARATATSSDVLALPEALPESDRATATIVPSDNRLADDADNRRVIEGALDVADLPAPAAVKFRAIDGVATTWLLLALALVKLRAIDELPDIAARPAHAIASDRDNVACPMLDARQTAVAVKKYPAELIATARACPNAAPVKLRAIDGVATTWPRPDEHAAKLRAIVELLDVTARPAHVVISDRATAEMADVAARPADASNSDRVIDCNAPACPRPDATATSDRVHDASPTTDDRATDDATNDRLAVNDVTARATGAALTARDRPTAPIALVLPAARAVTVNRRVTVWIVEVLACGDAEAIGRRVTSGRLDAWLRGAALASSERPADTVAPALAVLAQLATSDTTTGAIPASRISLRGCERWCR